MDFQTWTLAMTLWSKTENKLSIKTFLTTSAALAVYAIGALCNAATVMDMLMVLAMVRW